LSIHFEKWIWILIELSIHFEKWIWIWVFNRIFVMDLDCIEQHPEHLSQAISGMPGFSSNAQSFEEMN
jgi:hypothetical protein